MTSDWLLFFGHFHPLIVHLPIGFLLVAGLLEGGRRLGRVSVSDGTISAILFWSALSATLACVFGYWLSLGGGYNADILQEHQWQGIGVAAFAWVAWLAKSDRFGDRVPFSALLYGPALVLAIFLLGVAGHHGGSLTHGEDYLTQHTPEPFRSIAGLPPRTETVKAKPITNVRQAMVYEQIVNPVLQTHCVQCHNAGKAKGGLRYDTPAMLRKGGEDGPVFVAGKGAESSMVKRCLLPDDDEHHMPPKGKPQLTPDQIALLTWWIDEGAPFDKKVADLRVSETVRPALAMLGPGLGEPGESVAAAPKIAGRNDAPPAPLSPVLTMTVPPADPTAVTALKKLDLLVLPVSKELNQLEISAVNTRNFGDPEAALLPKLAAQIVWLKLGNTQVGDATLARVAMLQNLQKLHVEQTRVTDAGLKHLRNLTHLEYLNLYGTAITDAGLMELAGIKSLKTVYLWQTKTTEAGLAALRKARPDLDVVGGMGEIAGVSKL
jgi:mono/diheme cytochrome c family protein